MRVGRGGMWVGGAWQEYNRVQKYVKSVIYFHPPVTRPIKGLGQLSSSTIIAGLDLGCYSCIFLVKRPYEVKISK